MSRSKFFDRSQRIHGRLLNTWLPWRALGLMLMLAGALALAACSASSDTKKDDTNKNGTDTGGDNTTPPTLSIPTDAWTVLTHNPVLNDVIYAFGNKYIAVGTGGTVMTSPDGITWTRQTTNSTTNLYVVAADGSSRVLAAGSDGAVMSTDSGATWTESTLSCSSIVSVTALFHDGSKFIALGVSTINSSIAGVCWSNDGITWVPINQVNVTAPGTRLAYDGTTYMLVGISTIPSARSIDLGSWTSTVGLASDVLLDVVYDGTAQQFVGVSGTKVKIWSTGGSNTWADPATPPAVTALRSITYSSGTYSAVGDSGEIWTSTGSGDSWTDQTNTSVIPRNLRAVTTNGAGQFVAVGAYKTAGQSSGGTAWTQQSEGAGMGGSVNAIFGNSTGTAFIAAGNFSPISYTRGVATSSNGTTWTGQSSPATSEAINNLVRGTTEWLGVTNKGFARTTTASNGATWTGGTIEPNFTGVYADANRDVYYFSSYYGQVVSSVGNSLTKLTVTFPPGTPAVLNDIAVKPGTTQVSDQVVVAGAGGTVFYSTDGAINWTAASSNPVTASDIYRVYYDAGSAKFIALAGTNSIVSEAYYSTDGNAWTAMSQPLRDIALPPAGSSKNMLVIVGSNLLQSTDGITWTPVTTDMPNTISYIEYGPLLSTDNYALIGVGGGTTSGELWESLDDGATWTKVTLASGTIPLSVSDVVSDGTNVYVWVQGADGDTVYGYRKFTRTGPAAYSYVDPENSPARAVYDGVSSMIGYASTAIVKGGTTSTTWTREYYSMTGLAHLVYGLDRYVAAADAAIATTTAGTLWELQPYPGGGSIHVVGVAYNGSTYVVLGADNSSSASVSYTSTGGSTWTRHDITSPASGFEYGLACNGTTCVSAAFGNGGELFYTSSDAGVTWSAVAQTSTGSNASSAGMSDWRLKSIIWDANGSQFVAIASYDQGGYLIFTSADGTSWKVSKPKLPTMPLTLYSSPGFILLGGANGLIATHDLTFQ